MAEVKNVLSIDLDYVMGPCIQLYNGWVSNVMHDLTDEFGPQETGYYGKHLEDYWKWMNEDLYCERFYAFDNAKFEKVQKLLTSKVRNLSDSSIYFGKEHDAILTFLCGDDAKKNYNFNIYNIDHHHDIYYHDESREKIERFAFAGLAEWVWYLFDFGRLDNYYWIHNEESQYPQVNLQDYAAFNTMDDIKDTSDLENIDFDYIFICKSEYYVPLKYHFLFDTLKNSVETAKNTVFPIDNDSYCNGMTRFPVGW